MKKKLFYPNCSELVADFNTHNPKKAFEILDDLAKKFDWVFEPELSVKYLRSMVRTYKNKGNSDESIPSVMVIDSNGNSTLLEYGPNGYDDKLGFRLDSGCAHYDSKQFSFFSAAMEEANADLKSYDGGSTQPFYDWLEGNYED